MSLFNAPDNSTLSIGQLIAVGALFEIEPATIRMAVTRLIKDKLIARTERGQYYSGENATKLNSEIRSWRHAPHKTTPWKGDWLLALTHHLGRTNKTQLRARVRAFQLYGFVEIETGTWLRPANLVQEVDEVHQSLVELGMDKRVTVMNVNKVANGKHSQWCLKWPVSDIEANYLALINSMESSLSRLSELNNQDAAKESLLVGESAIRFINLDPLLPTEIINTALFEKVVTTMIKYDEAGQSYWQEFLSN